MRRRGRPPHPDVLTPREWEVLDLVRAGLTNDQIAARLGITPRTAKFHVSEILSKLGVQTRDQAAAWQSAPEPARARRWPALAWPMLARIAAVGILASGVAGLAILTWAAIVTDGPPHDSNRALSFRDRTLEAMQELRSYRIERGPASGEARTTAEFAEPGDYHYTSPWSEIAADATPMEANRVVQPWETDVHGTAEFIISGFFRYERFCPDSGLCEPWRQYPWIGYLTTDELPLADLRLPLISLEMADDLQCLGIEQSGGQILVHIRGRVNTARVHIELHRRLTEEAPSQICEALQTLEPAPPSPCPGVAWEDRLRGDLEWIVRKLDASAAFEGTTPSTMDAWISPADSRLNRLTLTAQRHAGGVWLDEYRFSGFDEVIIVPPPEFMPQTGPTGSP